MIFFVPLANYTFKCNAYYVVSTMPFVHFRATHLCHCERSVAISRKGYLIIKPTQDTCIMGPDGKLCTRWEKEYASVRQTFVACDDCLVKNKAYDAEKKAQTSKRVSIIARDNAISKSRRGPQKILLYFWGKGINKQKTNDCRKRQSFGQKRGL